MKLTYEALQKSVMKVAADTFTSKRSETKKMSVYYADMCMNNF